MLYSYTQNRIQYFMILGFSFSFPHPCMSSSNTAKFPYFLLLVDKDTRSPCDINSSVTHVNTHLQNYKTMLACKTPLAYCSGVCKDTEIVLLLLVLKSLLE